MPNFARFVLALVILFIILEIALFGAFLVVTISKMMDIAGSIPF